ncbi:acyl-CoA dehydrogenase family protein [Ilumatobacter sp.]|uniref:acyl-CoA dehydrogenase family protein n=1 Tax=Ilumatobacter sp. TaxID=1967498 RepID=UPI003750D359
MTSELNPPSRVFAGEPLLAETVERLFSDRCDPSTVRQAESTGWSADLWADVAAAGLPHVGVGAGSDNGTVLDSATILQLAGRHAVPLPLAETGMIGGRILASAGLPCPEGPLTVPVPHPDDTVSLTRRGEGWLLTGRLHRVPWASSADRLVLVHVDERGTEHAVSAAPAFDVQGANNLAGEPRDVVSLSLELDTASVVEVPPGTARNTRRWAALSRSLLVAGALERSAEMATSYAREREQFGQTLSRFQAIQHHLVLASEWAACAGLAAWIAAAAMMADESDPDHKVAIAKSVGHDATNIVTGRVHQVFGAIGMTKEHDLHLRTRRAWAWTDEWGSGRSWAEELGRDLIAGGDQGLWPTIASGQVVS